VPTTKLFDIKVPSIHYVPCHEIRRKLQPDEIPLDPTLPQMFVYATQNM